jgi:hypothetical protein
MTDMHDLLGATSHHERGQEGFMDHVTKSHVAMVRILGSIPAYTTWHNEPLDPVTLAIIDNSDKQKLLSVTAYALHRVLAEQWESDVHI